MPSDLSPQLASRLTLSQCLPLELALKSPPAMSWGSQHRDYQHKAVSADSRTRAELKLPAKISNNRSTFDNARSWNIRVNFVSIYSLF